MQSGSQISLMVCRTTRLPGCSLVSDLPYETNSPAAVRLPEK